MPVAGPGWGGRGYLKITYHGLPLHPKGGPVTLKIRASTDNPAWMILDTPDEVRFQQPGDVAQLETALYSSGNAAVGDTASLTLEFESDANPGVVYRETFEFSVGALDIQIIAASPASHILRDPQQPALVYSEFDVTLVNASPFPVRMDGSDGSVDSLEHWQAGVSTSWTIEDPPTLAPGESYASRVRVYYSAVAVLPPPATPLVGKRQFLVLVTDPLSLTTWVPQLKSAPGVLETTLRDQPPA